MCVCVCVCVCVHAPSLGHHLVVVEGLECTNEPRSYVTLESIPGEYGCPAPPYLGGQVTNHWQWKSSQVCTCVCKYVSVFVRYHNTIRSYTYHLTSIITASHVHTFKDMVGWFVVSSVVNLVGDNMLWLCYIDETVVGVGLPKH